MRRVFGITDSRAPLDEYVPELGESVGEALLRPTRIYVKALKALLAGGIDLHAVSHITGGGFYENVPRMMTGGLAARIELDAFPCPPIFKLIAQRGNIPRRDMYNTFNMGLGMLLAVPATQAAQALEALKACGENAWQVGSVVSGDAGVELVGL